jgi:regulator of replication initiation timing
MIHEILDLQGNLSELTQKVDLTKSENLQLKEENEVLREYIETLVASMGQQQKNGVAKTN